MIRVYCEDIDRRVDCQHFLRDHGYDAEALPPEDFYLVVNRPDTSAAILIRPFCPGAETYVDYRIPVFIVGASGSNEGNDFTDYESSDLLGVLEAVCPKKKKSSADNLLICDDYGAVYLGYRVSLTPTENAVLSYLTDNEGRYVSADELLRVCVGDVYRCPENVVQHVSSINRKLHRIGGRTVIKHDDGRYTLNENI